MKHINLSSWKLPITDWTELNYIKGGLADEYADIANVKGNYVKKSENLVNITELNYRLATNGTLVQSDNGNTTYFIEVKEGKTYSTNIVAYTTSNYLSIAYYDSDKAFVSGILANKNTSTITIPSGIAYMRASYRPSLQDNLMINKGSTLLPYQPGSTSGLYIEDNINDELIPINDPNVLTRVALSLSKNTSDILEEDIPIDSKDVK